MRSAQPEDVSMPEFEGFDWSGGNGEKNWRAHLLELAKKNAVKLVMFDPRIPGATHIG